MKLKFLFILLFLSNVSSSMENTYKTYSSADELPIAYQHPGCAQKPDPIALNLDQIQPHKEVPQERLDSWQPETLKKKGFRTIIGCSFLSFSESGFFSAYPDRFNEIKNASSEPNKSFYVSGFWYTSWLSASLVNQEKHPTCGNYGFILDIPPQLILKTYQLDSTTPMHKDLIEKKQWGKNIHEFVADYLKFPGCFNTRMDLSLPEGFVRIFADGENADSHPFMTPDEMIVRGRPNEHNEIKFVPNGMSHGQEYKTSITGLWYKDELDAPTAASDWIDGQFVHLNFDQQKERHKINIAKLLPELQEVAEDLRLPLVKLTEIGKF